MKTWLLTISFLLSGLSLSAQSDNTVEKAEMEFTGIETLSSDAFNVSITYYFTQPLGTEIELKVLDFGTPVAGSAYFRKGKQGSLQQIDFAGKSKVMSGRIDSLTAIGLGSQLTVLYQVPLPDMNDSFDFNIPIIYPNIASASNNAGLFTAAMKFPGTINLYEQFPAQTWSLEKAGNHNLHKLSLQAVPSVIKLTGGIEPQPMFSMLRLVDGFIIFILIILLFLGWKKIKQV
jgi:hypothetical protein